MVMMPEEENSRVEYNGDRDSYKFCTGCNHSFVEPPNVEVPVCYVHYVHLVNVDTIPVIDLVNGEIFGQHGEIRGKRSACWIMRGPGGECGPEGKLFQRQDPEEIARIEKRWQK